MLLVRPRRVLIEKRSIEADATARMGNRHIRYCMNAVNAGANCTYHCGDAEVSGRDPQGTSR